MSHYDCPCMEKCPLHYAMSVIGGKWKVQIVCALTNAGALRYNALRAKLEVERERLLSPYELRRRAEEFGMREPRPGQVRRMEIH